MNVSAYSIRTPLPAILLFILLTLIGVLSFRAMKNQQFPDVDLPMIIVAASLPGAAPTQMETEVARKLENSIATLTSLKHIYTKVSNGQATVFVEFRLEKPTQEALDDVRDAVSRVRADLPGAMTEPVITRSNLSGTPILTYTVSSPRMDDEAISWFVDHDVTKTLLSVPGVGSVSRVGGVTREIAVELDPARMLALGVAPGTVSRALRAIQQDASGGRSDIAGIEQSLRTIATVQSADELAAMSVALPDGRHVRLDQVARINDTVAEQRSAALLNGQRVVSFEIVRSRGAGEVQVARSVRATIESLRAEHPDIEITEAFNFVDQVQENFEGSMTLLFEGALLAIIVVWLFLRDWRATLVSATALPLSIIPTFGAMHLMGFSLNMVTTLSISLVVGILVDDAIVEIENIMRHLRMGKTPFEAALEAADEIGLAVIATTFTLIAVFLPTAFMSGVPGKFFVQFGWTAAIAVFFSLVVARMLTPMMAAYLLKPPHDLGQEVKEPAWMRTYRRWVTSCLHNRFKTVLVTTVFFVGAFALVPLIGKGFLPPDDLSTTQVYLSLQPGSTFKESLAIAEQARDIVQKNRHVKMVYTAIGGGRAGADPFAISGADDVRKSTLTINLTARAERGGVTKQDVERDFREALKVLPGVQVKVGFGGSAEKYVLVLASEDGRVLGEAAARVERELRADPVMGNIGAVWTTASLMRPELVVQPDFARAASIGVTTEAIADVLRIATAGDYEQFLPKLNLTQRQVPIVIKLPPAARQDMALLGQLPVPGAFGPVALHNVASLSLAGGPSEIDRYDRLRNINFEIELNGEPLGEVEERIFKLPGIRELPPGVIVTSVGDAEAMGELFTSFGIAIATGVLCIYMVLVLLFRDFVQPLTILAALILSIPGAFLALFLTGTALSMPSMIGLIMLMGIATKNSILLVDYVILSRREHTGDTHFSRFDALLDACRKRARPIIMTTVAMGAGMMPIALGLGNDPSFRAPMAIVVIGGVISSTFLSLLVIPVVFTYVDDAIQALMAGVQRLRSNPSNP